MEERTATILHNIVRLPRQCVVDIFIFGFIYLCVYGVMDMLFNGFNIDIH